MQNARIIIVFLAATMVLCACSNKGQTPSNVAIGTIMFQCYTGSAQLCESSSSGAMAYVGLTNDTQSTCASLIESAGSNFSSAFLASGSASASWDSSNARLIGYVSDWVNANQQTISELPSGSYRICAYLDVNSNGLLDSGEPYYSEIQSIGSAASPLEIARGWGQYNPNLPSAALSQLSPTSQF